MAIGSANPRKQFANTIRIADKLRGALCAKRSGPRQQEDGARPFPSSFRVVRVDCAAQVSGEWVIEAFSGGIDGVMVMGCHLDACRHQGANHRAHKKLETLRWLLSGFGIPPEKLCLSWGMGREALPFQEEVQKFVSALKLLKGEKKA